MHADFGVGYGGVIFIEDMAAKTSVLRVLGPRVLGPRVLGPRISGTRQRDRERQNELCREPHLYSRYMNILRIYLVLLYCTFTYLSYSESCISSSRLSKKKARAITQGNSLTQR